MVLGGLRGAEGELLGLQVMVDRKGLGYDAPQDTLGRKDPRGSIMLSAKDNRLWPGISVKMVKVLKGGS